MLYTARCWARFIFQSDWKNWCLSDLIPWVCHDAGSCLWTVSITHPKMGKQTIFIYKWVKPEGCYCDFSLIFQIWSYSCIQNSLDVNPFCLNLCWLFVACVYVSNYGIVSFEVVGFMNNTILAWSQEASCSYCDYSHHCTSGHEGSTQTLNLCKQHET